MAAFLFLLLPASLSRFVLVGDSGENPAHLRRVDAGHV